MKIFNFMENHLRKINSNLILDDSLDQLLIRMPETARNYAHDLRHVQEDRHQGYQALSKLKSLSPREQPSKFTYFAGVVDKSQRTLNRYNIGNRQKYVKLEEFTSQRYPPTF